MKSNEIALNSKHGTENIKNKNQGNRKTKSQKDKNLVLAKEQVENVDLYNPVLNKIMTTYKYCIKYNFVQSSFHYQPHNINQYTNTNQYLSNGQSTNHFHHTINFALTRKSPTPNPCKILLQIQLPVLSFVASYQLLLQQVYIIFYK